MKLLTAAQIHEWDAYTIAHEPISSIDLMEKAALACTNHITLFTGSDSILKVFCAKGNNGGDGLAIARQLLAQGYDVSVYILEFGARGSDDFEANLQRLRGITDELYFIEHAGAFPVLHADDIVIDALFGSGLNRPLQDLSAQLVQHINDADVRVFSVDVPSGMFTEGSSKGNIIVQATHTLTFQIQKYCFMLAENAVYTGSVQVLDIGLKESFQPTEEAIYHLITVPDLLAIYEPRHEFAHKGSYGHALLAAGSYGKMGAAVLAARACLRSGIGLLTTLIPEEGYIIMQTAVPEAMVVASIAAATSAYACLGVGPGLGTHEAAVTLVDQLLQGASQPMIIDADALNIISRHAGWLERIPENSILTPHPKEFDRLFGEHENESKRIEKAIHLSKQYRWVIVLKGHHSLVAWQGKGWFNTTGNAGMATGGSGDVLTGILTALMAQYKQPHYAALLGVYLHGLAADLALDTEVHSMESLLPSDIIDSLGRAFYAIA
ncbi:NAD(P)H-hydrate dehydratase [Filimonas effusa]|uniref:Bifunctional NAD(P)H-hydrate repair enzyme n=1 Tax=Filimonas effusa TaxID=2508721 RepID=A0A4Q1DBE7_9BACT|nr:NAD(P)H-hydrate dehydratase [Filimonas effusa]RXK86238.1 NAD(P)H-hydrate dehydratase [Filimonas effusa]